MRTNFEQYLKIVPLKGLLSKYINILNDFNTECLRLLDKASESKGSDIDFQDSESLASSSSLKVSDIALQDSESLASSSRSKASDVDHQDSELDLSLLTESKMFDGLKMDHVQNEQVYNALDLKKNLLLSYSVTKCFEVLLHHFDNIEQESESYFNFETEDEVKEKVSKVGKNENWLDFENSITRSFLIHLPRILDLYLGSKDDCSHESKINVAYQILTNNFAQQVSSSDSSSDSDSEDTRINHDDVELIQFIIGFFVLLNKIKTFKFTTLETEEISSSDSKKMTSNVLEYNYDPYSKKFFDGRPSDYNYKYVDGNDLTSLDETWLNNNISTISQLIVHQGLDIIFLKSQQEANLCQKIFLNPHEPLSLIYLKKFPIYSQNSNRVKSIVESYMSEANIPKFMDIFSQSDNKTPYLDCVRFFEDMLLNPNIKKFYRDNFKFQIKSGFEVEVGLIDKEMELENDPDILEKIRKCIIEVSQVDKGPFMKLVIFANVLNNLNKLHRSEIILLKMILLEKDFENLTLMGIERKDLHSKLFEFFSDPDFTRNKLLQIIKDNYYPYELNIDKPTSLTDTIDIAYKFESRLKELCEKFQVDIVLSPSYQLNVSFWFENSTSPSEAVNLCSLVTSTVDNVDAVSNIRQSFKQIVKEIEEVITSDFIMDPKGFIRVSKANTHLDYHSIKSFMPQVEEETKKIKSQYAKRRIETGRSVMIRYNGGEPNEARIEIRLFGDNPHTSAQMPNSERYSVRERNQSDILSAIGLSVCFSLYQWTQKYAEFDLGAISSFTLPSFQKFFEGRPRSLSNTSFTGSVLTIDSYSPSQSPVKIERCSHDIEEDASSRKSDGSKSILLRVPPASECTIS